MDLFNDLDGGENTTGDTVSTREPSAMSPADEPTDPDSIGHARPAVLEALRRLAR